MADVETVDVDEFRTKLKEDMDNLETLNSDLITKAGNTETVINGINNESSSAIKWFSDNVFRPGNGERKKEAVNALKILLELLNNSHTTASYMINKYLDLRSIGDDMARWRKTILDIFPVIEASICVPQPDLPDTIGWDISFGVLAGVTGLAVISVVGLPIAAVTGAAALIVGFVGAIITGNERMHAFEDLKQDAENSSNKVQTEILDKLTDAKQKMDTFFSQAAESFKTAGWYTGDATNTSALAAAIHKKVLEMATIASAYKAMKGDIKYGIPVESAAEKESNTFWEGKSPEVINAARQLLLTATYMEQGMSPTDIANRLHLNEDQTKRLEARAMLANGKTPQEISDQLSIPVETVTNIQHMLQYNKAA